MSRRATRRRQAGRRVGDGRMSRERARDKPWVMRTYSGHSTARASNELYRTNLAKGQTGLSIAFDLPTQIGYDPDAPEAAGEVGKVGVPVAHLGHMPQLLDQIPVESMNTSMTINATAAWLLGLYVANAEDHGVDPARAVGHDPERHREGVPVPGDLHLPAAARACGSPSTPSPTRCARCPSGTRSTSAATTSRRRGPRPPRRWPTRWPPPSACSTRCGSRARSPTSEFPAVVGRISLLRQRRGAVRRGDLQDAGLHRTCGTGSAPSATASTDPKLRRFRYGVQVNSLGLTEAQPENNVPRIVLESLGVTLSKRARARAMQLPAWNEALGLPRPWDQQWSLRIQQILAFESDLLEYGDIFDGSVVIEAKTAEVAEASVGRAGGRAGAGRGVRGHRRAEGAAWCAARPSGSGASRPGELQVVGVNCFTETAPVAAGLGRRRDRQRPEGRPGRRGGAVAPTWRLAGRPGRRPRSRRPSTI